MRAIILVALLLAMPAWGADRVVRQEVALPGGTLAFTAAVETIRLVGANNAPAAEIVTTAFLGDDKRRPVTFVFNGGPGAASAWLNMGAVGPWRVKLTTPSADPTPLPNAETWLPFTDLVFIDPVGTGYSRALGDDAGARLRFFSVEGDVESLAAVIRRWLEAHDRLAAPKFILGESYGGFRAPRVARSLLEREGVGIAGLVLVSPVLDFNGRDSGYDPVRWAARLPSLVAGAKAARSRSDLRDAEEYARGEYLIDLMRGPRDAAAVARITARVSAMTGLDPETVRRRGGRIDFGTALRETRTPGHVASPYDSTIRAADPFPAAPYQNAPDVVLDGYRATVTGGMLEVYRRLGWQPEGAPARQYQLLAPIAGGWNYGTGNNRPESMTALRQFLSLDPAARVLVVHGVTDLVTPYFASVLLLDQVPETEPAGRLELRAYPGGHMMYSQDGSRAALAADAAAFIASAVGAEATGAGGAAGAGIAPPPASPGPAPGSPAAPATPR